MKRDSDGNPAAAEKPADHLRWNENAEAARRQARQDPLQIFGRQA